MKIPSRTRDAEFEVGDTSETVGKTRGGGVEPYEMEGGVSAREGEDEWPKRCMAYNSCLCVVMSIGTESVGAKARPIRSRKRSDSKKTIRLTRNANTINSLKESILLLFNHFVQPLRPRFLHSFEAEFKIHLYTHPHSFSLYHPEACRSSGISSTLRYAPAYPIPA